MHKNKTVEEFLSKATNWNEELHYLRDLMLSLNMNETVKWGFPVYTDDNGKNIVGIAGFKQYVGIWFYQGVFLEDKKQKLMNAQEGKTKALRQWKFDSLEEIKREEKTILAYANEALLNSMAGKEIKPQAKKIELPELLESALEKDADLKSKFESLTKGKQKEFMEYITQAKREETKIKRLEKIKPMIMEGVGLNDKYRNA